MSINQTDVIIIFILFLVVGMAFGAWFYDSFILPPISQFHIALVFMSYKIV